MKRKATRVLTEAEITRIEQDAYRRGQESVRELVRALLSDAGCPSLDGHERHYHGD